MFKVNVILNNQLRNVIKSYKLNKQILSDRTLPVMISRTCSETFLERLF